jgi:FixJ family two-component response regulator
MSTVFIVDDDLAVRSSLAASLEERGMQVACFSSGEEFLSHYRDDSRGCLILDLNMPGMSGLDVQQALLDNGCPLPVIFITGFGTVPAAVRAIKNAAVDFLDKPYRLDSLLSCIAEAMTKDSQRQMEAGRKRDVMERLSALTAREREVLLLLVAGSANSTNKQIAKRLNISHRTVAEHRERIMKKLRAKSVSDLVDIAAIGQLLERTVKTSA